MIQTKWMATVASVALVFALGTPSFADCGGCEGEGQQAKQDDCGGCEGEQAKQQAKQDDCGGCEGEQAKQDDCGGCEGEQAKKESGGCCEEQAAACPALEKFASMAGEWEGDRDGDGKADVEVSYKVTAGGSAVVETLFPGTPHEMVTVYHRDGEGLMLTHYCATGSQPRMRLAETSEDGKTMRFEYVDGANCDPAKGYMGRLVVTMTDGEHATYRWTVLKDGKDAQVIEFTLNRRKSGKAAK